MRGTSVQLDEHSLLLYTRGSVPYFRTYPGLYVPQPLLIRPATDGTDLRNAAAAFLQVAHGLDVAAVAASRRGAVASQAGIESHRHGTLPFVELLMRRDAAQPGQGGEHPPAVVWVAGEIELGVDPRDIRFHGLHAQAGDRCDSLV